MEKQEKLLLRGKEVADALNISRALAYRWMAAGILTVVRVPGGRSIRVPQQALLRWIDINTAGADQREKITAPIASKQRTARRGTGADGQGRDPGQIQNGTRRSFSTNSKTAITKPSGPRKRRPQDGHNEYPPRGRG